MSIPKVVETVAAAAARTLGLRQEVEHLEARTDAIITKLREGMEATRRALGHAERGPRPAEEVCAAFDAWVDQTAAYQRKEYGRGLVIHRFGAATKGPDTGAPWGPTAELTWGFASLFFGPELKARFAELVRATEYMPGPAEAERPGVVARLRRELTALEREEEAAVEAGHREHRPEVVARKEQEARQRELTAQTDDARRAREAALDARHAQQPRSAPPPYLEANRIERAR